MTEPATEEKTSSSSGCVSPSKKQTLSMPDWSLLPEELLLIISKKLKDEDYCFDVVHARSVCGSWRSSFPFPSCLLRPSYSLPSFADNHFESQGLCTLEKIPVFLFRIRAPATDESPFEYFLGDIGRDNSEDHMELSSPIQCSVKVKIPGSDPTMMKLIDCQILSLGHQYRMIGWDPKSYTTPYRGVAFLPLDKEGGGEFVVLIAYAQNLLVLRTAEMRWMRLAKTSRADCKDLFTFRGRFYAAFLNGDVFVIDPYSLEATHLMTPHDLNSTSYLVPAGNDELFLIEIIIPRTGTLDFSKLACRVSRLDEQAGTWVVVSDLGDRVLFIGNLGNCAFSAKELPDGCGVSGNSVLFTNGPGNITYAYKYGVHTENAGDDLNFWRFSTENCVTILNGSPPVVALRVER